MECGVRQDCPMAPYLYLFVANVLGYILSNPRYNIQNLILPNDQIVRDMIFADDTSLYLRGTKENLQNACTVIEKLYAMFGARINWSKSIAIWVFAHDRPWSWGDDMGVKWLRRGETARYLDFLVDMVPNDKDEKVLQKIRAQLNVCCPKKLSMAEKIIPGQQPSNPCFLLVPSELR